MVALVVLAAAAGLGACSAVDQHPLTEAEWATIEHTRDSVEPPVDYRRSHEDRYGGDGCSWGPSCEGDPSSTVEYEPTRRTAKIRCAELRRSLDRRYPEVFESITDDPFTCVNAGKLDGQDVRVTLHPRTGLLRVQAGTMKDDPDPYGYCDYGDPDPEYEPECFQ